MFKKIANNQVQLGGSKLKPILIAAIAVLVLAAGAIAAQSFLATPKRYWALPESVATGTNLAEIELVQVDANLNGEAYLVASEPPTGFTTRAFQTGELLTSEGVTTNNQTQLARIVVATSPTSESVKVGTQVQVWSAAKFETDIGMVYQLLESAEVVRILETKSVFSQNLQQVEIAIDSLELPAVLDAVATESTIFLVPVK